MRCVEEGGGHAAEPAINESDRRYASFVRHEVRAAAAADNAQQTTPLHALGAFDKHYRVEVGIPIAQFISCVDLQHQRATHCPPHTHRPFYFLFLCLRPVVNDSSVGAAPRPQAVDSRPPDAIYAIAPGRFTDDERHVR